MSTSEMKPCPYCGEEIRAIAIRCKHCQMMLDGSGARGDTGPSATDEYGAGTQPGNGPTRLKPGSVLGSGRFELKQLLGKGGMGEVYLAEHRYTGQKLALKAVWPNLMDSEGTRKRFLQEGRVLAQLQHPNIVGLADFFEEDGRFFLVMEYVEGETLGAYLSAQTAGGRKVAVGEAKRILEGVLKGLSHAHAQTPQVVHRDVKPSNVMLAKDGRVVLMDFGIAKVAEGEKITRTAGVVGTYEYMSPEQVSGKGISPATDVYAVGILAYELLTGDVPFPQRDDSGFDAMEGHKTRRPSPALSSRPDCTPELSAWVDRALAKSPAARYRDAGAMLAALQSGGEAVAAGGSGGNREWMGGVEPGAEQMRTQPPAQVVGVSGAWRNWAIGAVLVAVVLGALVYLLGRPKQEASPVKEAGKVAEKTVIPAQPVATNEEAAAARAREAEAEAKAAEEARKAADALKEAEAAKAEAAKAAEALAAANAAAEQREEAAKKESAKRVQEARRQAEVTARREAEAAEKRRQAEAAREAAEAARKAEESETAARKSQKRFHVSYGGYDFFIDRYEVSHDEYMGCVTDGPCSSPDWYSCINLTEVGGEKEKATGFGRPGWHRGNHPAICVTPVDAATYCRSVGGRLPTMSEWQIAEGGSDGRRYPWGNSPLAADKLNMCANECLFSWGKTEMDYRDPHSGTAPVDALPLSASPFGPEQMAGNVWEWVMKRPGVPSAKGGAWNGSARDVGVGSEYASVNNQTRWNSIGFRCAYDD